MPPVCELAVSFSGTAEEDHLREKFSCIGHNREAAVDLRIVIKFAKAREELLSAVNQDP